MVELDEFVRFGGVVLSLDGGGVVTLWQAHDTGTGNPTSVCSSSRVPEGQKYVRHCREAYETPEGEFG
jgi:hypothetical protein